MGREDVGDGRGPRRLEHPGKLEKQGCDSGWRASKGILHTRSFLRELEKKDLSRKSFLC